MKNTEFKIVDSDVLYVTVNTPKWTKLGVDEEKTFSKIVIDSPDVQAHIDFSKLKYNSLEFTNGSKISNITLALIDYDKLTEVDGVRMEFTDYQIDSSFAFIVQKFVEKGYTIPKELDPDLGWLWYDPSYDSSKASTPRTYGLKIEYQDGTVVDNTDGQLDVDDTYHLIESNKRFRIKKIASSSNTIAQLVGIIGDIYLDGVDFGECGINVRHSIYNTDDYISACCIKRIFIVNSSLGSIIASSCSLDNNGNATDLKGAVVEGVSLKIKPTSEIIIKNSSIIGYQTAGYCVCYAYAQYIVGVDKLTKTYTIGTNGTLICDCPDAISVGTNVIKSPDDIPSDGYKEIMSHNFCYILGNTGANAESDIRIYSYIKFNIDVDIVIDIDGKFNNDVCMGMIATLGERSGHPHALTFKDKTIDDIQTCHNVYIDSCALPASKYNSAISVWLLPPSESSSDPRYLYVNKISSPINLASDEGVDLKSINITNCTTLQQLELHPTDPNCGVYADSISLSNISKLDVDSIHEYVYDRLLYKLDQSKVSSLSIRDVKCSASHSLDGYGSLNTIYISGCEGFDLNSINPGSGNLSIYCDIIQYIDSFKTPYISNVYIERSTGEQSCADFTGKNVHLYISTEHFSCPDIKIYGANNIECGYLGTNNNYQNVAFEECASKTLNLNNYKIDSLILQHCESLSTLSSYGKVKKLDIIDCPEVSHLPMSANLQTISLKHSLTAEAKDFRKWLRYANMGTSGRELTINLSEMGDVYVRPDTKVSHSDSDTHSLCCKLDYSAEPGITIEDPGGCNIEILDRVYKAYPNQLASDTYIATIDNSTFAGYQGFTYAFSTSTSSTRSGKCVTVFVKSDTDTDVPIYAFSNATTSRVGWQILIDGVQQDGNYPSTATSALPSVLPSTPTETITIPGDSQLHTIIFKVMCYKNYKGTLNLFIPNDIF